MTAPKDRRRPGGKCACGCGRLVPDFTGKGSHRRIYFNAACGVRVRVARWEANNPELAAERKRACKDRA